MYGFLRRARVGNVRFHVLGQVWRGKYGMSLGRCPPRPTAGAVLPTTASRPPQPSPTRPTCPTPFNRVNVSSVTVKLFTQSRAGIQTPRDRAPPQPTCLLSYNRPTVSSAAATGGTRGFAPHPTRGARRPAPSVALGAAGRRHAANRGPVSRIKCQEGKPGPRVPKLA
eukprot:126525-Chlamydomonas_euryale.AAC.4